MDKQNTAIENNDNTKSKKPLNKFYIAAAVVAVLFLPLILQGIGCVFKYVVFGSLEMFRSTMESVGIEPFTLDDIGWFICGLLFVIVLAGWLIQIGCEDYGYFIKDILMGMGVLFIVVPILLIVLIVKIAMSLPYKAIVGIQKNIR